MTFPSQIRSAPRTPEISSYGVNLKDGKRDGLVTFWCRNGRKSLEGVFKEGKPDGAVKSYYENGRISCLTSGSPNGTNTSWHENGQKQRVSTYRNGKLVSRKVWNQKGKEIETLRRAPE